MPEQEFALSRIGQVSISVGDLVKSIEFYRDVLGIRFLFNVDTMAFFDCDGVSLMLGIPERPEFKSRSLVYFTVPEIQDAFTILQSRGVQFNGKPHVVHSTDTYDL